MCCLSLQNQILGVRNQGPQKLALPFPFWVPKILGLFQMLMANAGFSQALKSQTASRKTTKSTLRNSFLWCGHTTSMKRLTIWKCGSKELCPRNPYWMSLRGLVLQGVWSRHFSCGVTLKYHSKNERTIGFINHSLQNVHGFHHWLLTPEHCSGLRCDFQPDRSRHFEPVHLPRSFDAKPNTVTFQVWNLVCLVDLIFPWTEFF